MEVNYTELFKDLKTWLEENRPIQTQDITESIKEFFRSSFSPLTVLPNGKSGEYLLDIMVTNFTPLKVVNKISLKTTQDSINIFVAAESELGGSGASSAYGVHKNVVEDYIKLMLVASKYKVMVFTSLPYKNEEHHIENRAESLRDLYQKTNPNAQGVLLVHLQGSQPISSQVQASVDSINGFIISGNGEHLSRI